MSTKYKAGDRVWVKAVVADMPSCDGAIWLNVAGRPMWTTAANIRPCVKRKKPPSPWQPIEGAPKDGTSVLLRRVNLMGRVCFHVAAYVGGFWMTDGNVVFEPTHWMPIPTLEVL